MNYCNALWLPVVINALIFGWLEGRDGIQEAAHYSGRRLTIKKSLAKIVRMLMVGYWRDKGQALINSRISAHHRSYNCN